MKKADKRQRRKITEAARAVADASPFRRGVLVVESDPDMQWKLARTLTTKGGRVVGTSSGDGALALIAECPMDLVLVDEDLPGMSGLEVARRLRDARPDVPVVLMTGKDGTEVQMAARLAGVVATLTKPFRLEALSEVLESLKLDPLPQPAE